MIKHDTLLLCSPTREGRKALRHIFSNTFYLLESGDPDQLLLLLNQNASYIAAVLLDISGLSPQDIARLDHKDLRRLLNRVPVIVLTDTETPELIQYAFGHGAADVISTGYPPAAMLRRVENIVALHLHKQHLETVIEEHQNQLTQHSTAIVDALSSIIEYRSVESGQHILRIRHFTKLLLEEVAKCCPEYQLTEESISIISSASALHDIGKIAIPDRILMKSGKLTNAEWEIMKTHTVTGCHIIDSLENTADWEYLHYAQNICRYHHERWDGNGYPEGLMGEAIPICAQVVSLADAYDALTSARVYKEAFSFTKAVNMIFRGECGTFSPKLLECFKHVVPKFEALAAEYADGKSPDGNFILPEPALPEKQKVKNSIDLIQAKYHALVHYFNGFVIEFDADRQMIHLVYNPYPELVSLQEVHTLDEIRHLLCHQYIHPDDKDRMVQFLDQELSRFLEDGQRRASYRFRFNSTVPVTFELTLLRISALDDINRRLLVLAKRIWPDSAEQTAAQRKWEPTEYTFHCKNDAELTQLTLNPSRAQLAGYTADEIREHTGNRFLELVYPEDRHMVRQHFALHLHQRTSSLLEHRIVHKDGSVHWVCNHSRLISTPDGHELIYGLLIDTQNLHRDDTALHKKLQRYEMILAQTENVLFEWDSVQNALCFSDNWEKLFGYRLSGSDARWDQHWSSCIHPDDMPLLADCISNLKNGSSYEMTEIRVSTAQGRYLWCRFRATAIRDSRGNLVSISGIIINIDAEKKAAQALQSRAEQDPLTKLLNKDAARKQARKYFLRYSLNPGGALLIIDIDDFKQVNDRYGHLFGDAVLSTLAQEIKQVFREQDIVARIGGDEFMVVMRGCTDAAYLEERCQKLIQVFQAAFRSYGLTLTCSIGIALSPSHAQSYHELFQYADQALYYSKATGKNRYAIYNPEDSAYLNHAMGTSMVSNLIDSDSEPGMANDNVVRYAFQTLYASEDTEKSINELLGFIGGKMNVSRVYVFENSDDNRFCRNTYEWCSQGISPQIQNLQNISYETDVPGFADYFDEQGIFYCPDVELLPKSVYDIVAPQGVKAMLNCAIRETGIFRGFIGFGDCVEPRLWTKEQIELLTFFSDALSIFLQRHRRQEKVHQQAEELQFILDNQDAWIYVVNPHTHELLHLNSRLKEKHPHISSGIPCYQALMNRSTPCPYCPLNMPEHSKTHSQLLRSTGGRNDLLLEATKIQWNGQPAVLVSGRRLPEKRLS